MPATMGQFGRMIRGGLVQIPAMGVAFFSKVEFMISLCPDPHPRRRNLRLPADCRLDIGNAMDAVFRSLAQGCKAFRQSMQVDVGIDKAGQYGGVFAIDDPGIPGGGGSASDFPGP